MRPILNASDVVVLCSEAEPLGTSILEAMAMGKPVLVPQDGGLREIVRSEVDGGYCVSPDDTRGMAVLIDELVASPEKRIQLGRSARIRVENSVNVKVVATHLASIYRETLS
jgi:glycosyltransferase involved in cell wall biosynthesis